MARKSRKITEFEENNVEITSSEKIYKTAIYARLSSEDLSIKDGGTIENQILLVQKYIETKPDLKFCETFIDNGETGTNFDRNGWQKLMEAVRRGKIDCIAVKDLSRLGRDYIEVGNYLEKVFPFLGVRFISVNDNYDSSNPAKNGDNLTIILKNLINDMYAKDISKKIKSAYQTMRQKGEYNGNHAPYGYIKSPENKHKLIIDEEAAPIVRDIFRWKSEGLSNFAIARKLNEKQILSPANYCYAKGILTHSKYSKKILWTDTFLHTMLTNTVYIGHMAQGKRQSDLAKSLPIKIIPKEKWVVVENTHEPIIDIDTFETVQKIIEERKDEYDKLKDKYIDVERTENIFAGFIYCANCDKRIKRRKRIIYGKSHYNYICPSYSIHAEKNCMRKYMSENDLKGAVFFAVKQQISLFGNMESRIKNINSSLKIKKRGIELQSDMQELEQKLANINSRKIILYNDFTDGLLTEKEYGLIRQKYDFEIVSVSEKLNEDSEELKKYNESFITDNKYAAEMQRFREITELTREMLEALIEKILIYSDNRIEIKFKYKDEFAQLQDYIAESEAGA